MTKGKQTTLSMAGFDRFAKPTRRELFLAEMDKIVPWSEACALVEPCYPKQRSGAGRPPMGLERMLRIYFLQQWFNLSDPAAEEALYDSLAMRRFVGIDPGREPVPDETTLCKFRHLLEAQQLGKALFEQVHRHLEVQGIKISRGTIVDATIINAPSSTKNAERQRDPDMHQTKKGQQWYFGMKAHLGVDTEQVIHSVVATAANVADSAVLPDLLHGEETRVYGDQAWDRAGSSASTLPGPQLHQPALPAQGPGGRSTASEEPHQVQGTCQGRARRRGDQAHLRVREGALPWAGEKRSWSVTLIPAS